MKRISILVLAIAGLATSGFCASPLRVLVDAGESPAGAKLQSELTGELSSHGANVVAWTGGAPFGDADVLVLYREDMKPVSAELRTAIETFAARGGGLVFLHGGAAAGDAAWLKPLIGGAWVEGKSRDFSSKMMLYVATDQHPIVRGASAFDLDDLTLYDLDLDPAAHVLASAFTPKITGLKEERREAAQARAKQDRANIYDIEPQWWAFESTAPAGGKSHRAVVGLQGGEATLQHSSIQTFILRGIAWTGGRENIDEFCSKEQLASLRYPAGGPERPEDTVKQFQIHPDFKASVVAAEPLINKPIAVQWDGAGRMWVAETPEYPNGRRPTVAEPWRETGSLAPGNYDRPARDRISILTDPDANGRFTKKTVFYEGLELVTGFCLYRDGVIALAEPDIVFIHGEGKEQKVQPLYTGFKPGDTHFVGNHLIVAADGWIYADMGGGADVKKPGTGEAMARISSGMFRFKPDGSAIEQISSKGGNGFGADVTSDGELFFGQATSGNPIQHVALPEKTLSLGKVGTEGGAQSVIKGRKVARDPLPDRVPLMQIDMVGGYSAACSSLIYEGGAWPSQYDGSMFCTEPILNIIHHEILKPNGATFTGEMVRTGAEFIYSPDYWFRPVDVACGPDGALYILDFYNPVIAHSDTRGPLHSKAGASVRPDREHYFGRIYRVQYDHPKQFAIPDLTKASIAELTVALSHPNRIVRFNALRILMEKNPADVAAALKPIAAAGNSIPARILALWGLERTGALRANLLQGALQDGDPAIRKTGALIAESAGASAVQSALAKGVVDSDPRARIAMLRGLSAADLDKKSAEAIVNLFPKLTDDLTKSAAVAAAANSPVAVIEAAFDSDKPEALRDLVSNVAAVLVEKQDADAFVKLVDAIAAKSPATDPLKRVVLEAADSVRKDPAAAASAEALRALLHSRDGGVVAAAIPLASRWDKTGALKADAQKITATLLAQLADQRLPDSRRAEIAAGLIGARAGNAEILPTMENLLTGEASDNLKRDVIRALGATGDAAVGPLLVRVFERLPALVQPAAFELLVSRPEWTNAFLDAAEARKVKISVLGPASIFRLRTHPDKAISGRANAMLDKVVKPNTDKDALIAQLTPQVIKPGNAAHGKELFTQICAVCHKFDDIGKEVGPVLTGIGAHGPEELLVSIVDPNRQIDAGYELFNVETKDGQLQSGILAQENDARIVLRSPAGDVEIPKANVKTSVNTHRSLMPEGFESLGVDSLRDILTFICGGESRFRVLDLSRAYTADTRRGLYNSQEALHDTLPFKKFGIVTVDGIPFDIVNPESSPLGGNVIVLRGGGRETFAHTLPKEVEVPVGLPAKSFDFLGGVAGWGTGKPESTAPRPCMKVTAVFADGTKESTLLHDGVEFADYVRRIDVPGSRYAGGVLSDKQVRWFRIPVTHAGMVQKLVLESFDNGPAATTVAITADLSDKPVAGEKAGSAPVVKPAAPLQWDSGTKVLVLGGGSSHDFEKWFDKADVATLEAANPKLSIHYTEDVDLAASELPHVDVLVSSTNQGPMAKPEMRKALADFAAAGKGVVLLHPGVWYNWRNWPEYNKELVGGGAHGHDAISEFGVKVLVPTHPVMAGLPPEFKVTDELYNVIVDAQGSPIETLATATSLKSGKTFPSIWIVKHPHSKIVCIALGHDGRVHDLPEYKKLLANAVAWAGAR